MRSVLNIVKLILVSLLVLLAIGIGTIFTYRAYRQHVNASAMAIHQPNGIDEAMYVKIGGIDQWIQIRGQDRNNPVLLCLHGGPGATWLPLTALFVPWEKEFTVVQWDQRGAGKTLEATGPSIAASMSIDRMAQDGIEVAEFLRTHLHKSKIVLLGHSFGSILGIHMAKERPDLFYAFVGTGQASNLPKSLQIGYARLLERARAAHDTKAVNELERIGPPPFHREDQVLTYFNVLGPYQVAPDREAQSSLITHLMFGAPNFSVWDIYNRTRGFVQVPTWQLYQEMLSTDLVSLGPGFQIPIYFFQGAQDDVTPAALAKDYFDQISAPHKEFVLFEGHGHFAVWTAANEFLQELLVRVRPLALAGALR